MEHLINILVLKSVLKNFSVKNISVKNISVKKCGPNKTGADGMFTIFL